MGDWDDDWDDKPKGTKHEANQNPFRARHNDDWNNNPDRHASNNAGDQISFEIDRSHVGMVIGKGGSKIKEIENHFNVNLKIGKYHSSSNKMQKKISFIASNHA